MDPLGTTAEVFVRGEPFLSPWQGIFLIFFFHKNDTTNHQTLFFSNCFVPWQETFADAGDGDGGTI